MVGFCGVIYIECMCGGLWSGLVGDDVANYLELPVVDV